MNESRVRRIKIKNHLVGIVDLDRVLEEVAKKFSAHLEEDIAEEMLRQLSVENYIPRDAKDHYKKAFVREYRKYMGLPVEEDKSEGLEVIILGPGCARCNQLEKDCRNVMEELKLAGSIEHIENIKEITRYRVKGTPALIINGQVVSVGKLPPKEKIREWLLKAWQE
ncbi:MAG: thioredoxin family protein [Syntrophales bacterium]|nr:thioredoxin family protein [Syntrophales bacterium]